MGDVAVMPTPEGEPEKKHCPTCDSPDPKLHPAVQHEGEVQPCKDAFHETSPEVLAPAEAGEPKCHKCGSFAFHICSACKKPHCTEHTSNVDLSNCVDCSEPVIIETHKVSRRDEDYDEITDETVYNTYEAKQVKFTGRHWLSNATIIASLSDMQLKSALEYHKGMISQLEFELTARKIHRNKEEYGYATRPKAGKDRVVTSTETRTTKTVRVKKVKEVDPLEALAKLAADGKIDLKKMQEMLQQKLAAKNLGVDKTGTEGK